jgi:AraC-like DNA-binding protein
MSKQKIILYSKELPDCPYCYEIFNSEYKTWIAKTEEEFFTKLQTVPADAAILCFCSAREEDVENVLRLDALTGPVPVLTCSKTLNPEFIRKAAQRGAARFLVCDMKIQKIRDIINDAIRDNGLKEYVEERWPDSLESSPYTCKILDEIIHFFPHRMKAEEFAERLGIDRGWLHKICKEAFGIPFTALLRSIWVHQALRMMQHTNLDNIDIALQLDYSEESSMAREFRKELGCCPNEARILLNEQSPEEILC